MSNITNEEAVAGLTHIQEERGYKPSWVSVNAKKLFNCDVRSEFPYGVSPQQNDVVDELVAGSLKQYKESMAIRIPQAVFYAFQHEIGLGRSKNVEGVQEHVISLLKTVVAEAAETRVSEYLDERTVK